MIKTNRIYILSMFVEIKQMLFKDIFLEFRFIYISHLILLVHLGESLGDPHVLTLFIRFYYIYDDG